MRRFVRRHQQKMPLRALLLAGVGTFLVVGVIAWFDENTALPLLVASLGSSCALVFIVPHGPLSQPANVVGGQLVCTLSGLLASLLLPVTWWSVSLAVACAVVVMTLLRVTHPPAGANPIIVMTTSATWTEAVIPILIGATAVVILASLYHRATGVTYPIPAPRRERSIT